MQEIMFLISEEFEEYEDMRIDKCISQLMDPISRSYLQKLIKDELITVNGKCTKANYNVKLNDCLKIQLPDATEPDILPEDIPLDVIYEDSDLLVINKPKGMVVHPASGHYTQTLVNAVLFHCKGNLSGINGVLRPGIVHRIDMDTTGSVLICKNDLAHASLAEQFSSHTIKRKYRAIVHGILKPQEGTIDSPIGRNENDRKKMAIRLDGRRAITHYTLIKQFRDYAYIECSLETGRTHQIRVHMASIGHPLLGDELYSNRKSPYNLHGQTLHAYLLGFIHPRTNEYIETIAPFPEYFEHLLSIMM